MPVRGRPVTLSDADLLDVAKKVFLERGLDATTAEIAQRARISESVIFHRYKTKEALFSAVFERQMSMPPAMARLPALVGTGDIAEHLFDAGMGMCDIMQAMMPLLMMALSSARMNPLRRQAKNPHPLKRQALELLSGYCDAEARAGRLRGINGEVFARCFLGGIMQYSLGQNMEAAPTALEVPEFLRGMIDLLLSGASNGKSSRRR
jgi:AcrR family transcriptional regulator